MRQISLQQKLKNAKRFEEVKRPKLLNQIKQTHVKTWKVLTSDHDLLQFDVIPTSAFYHGNVGAGKTVAAVWHMVEWARLNYINSIFTIECLFVTAKKLLDLIKDTFSDRSNVSDKYIIKLYETIPFLLLDDLSGVQCTDWGYSLLLRIIDTRWSMERTTVFTDNLDLNKLADHWKDDRIPDRIKGMCGENHIYHFNSNSRR